MSIRTRLTLWYAGVMFVSLLAMGVTAYHEFAPERGCARPAPRTKAQGERAGQEDFGEVSGLSSGAACRRRLLALAGGWWLMRRALAPVAALTQAAERINEHNLGERLPRTGNGDELDRLTEVFNAMTARLDDSFARIREFTLHASHELKTPLTVLHGELETALQRRIAPRAGARAAGQPARRSYAAWHSIVDGLTLLAKADAGQMALKLEPVRLDELVRELSPMPKSWPGRSTFRSNWPHVKKFPCAATAIGCANCCSTSPTTPSNTTSRKAA